MAENEPIERIDGIGPARARALQSSLGVASLDDLAHHDPDDIERAIKATGAVGVSRADIESWVAQAQDLIAAESTARVHPSASLDDGMPVASFVIEAQAREADDDDEPVQIHAHYVEGDQTEILPGLQPERLAEWIMTRVRRVLSESSVGTEPSVTTGQIDVESRHVQRFDARILLSGAGFHAGAIPSDCSWSVVFEWSTEAPEPRDLDGEWRLDVVTRPMRPGAPTLRLRSTPIGLADTGGQSFRVEYGVPAGVATSDHWGTPYRALAVLTHARRGDPRGYQAAAAEVGVLFFCAPARADDHPASS